MWRDEETATGDGSERSIAGCTGQFGTEDHFDSALKVPDLWLHREKRGPLEHLTEEELDPQRYNDIPCLDIACMGFPLDTELCPGDRNGMHESHGRFVFVPLRGLAVCAGGECRCGRQPVPYDKCLTEQHYLRQKLRSQKGQVAVRAPEC